MNQRKNLLAVLTVAAAALMALAATASATTLTSPTGTTYTGNIWAEAGYTQFTGPFTAITCNSSRFTARVEKHGAGVTAGGNISSLTFSGCNYPVKVLNSGSLEIHHTSGYNGTVTSSGMQVTLETSIANCLYSTSGTDLGTLTGGKPAYLDVNAAAIPRTGHSFFCGSSGAMWANYHVWSPTSLYVDA